MLDDLPGSLEYKIYVDATTRIVSAPMDTQIEVHAFGERVAYKRSSGTIRAAETGWAFQPPPEAWGALLALAIAALGVLAVRAGVPVLVVARPARSGVAVTLVVVLVLAPLPPAPSRAGGGGGSVIHWELADRLGTGLVMVDETGALLVHRTFTPFGALHDEAGDADWLPRNYAGHLWEDHAGLYYMQARWMDPATGTFLSVDPVVGDPADPQSHNAYSYAQNNPVANLDPTGACIMSDCGYWYGQLPPGMSPNQVANGFNAQFANPGNLADSGAMPGMFVSDFVSGGKPPSLFSFVGSIAESVYAFFGAVTYPTYLKGVGKTPDGLTDFNFEWTGQPIFDHGAAAVGAFRLGVFDYSDPLGGSYLLEAATLIPAAKIAKVGKVGVAASKAGRLGKQQRLKALADDPKVSTRDRGWIKQEQNAIQRGNRSSIRVPPGKNLAHRRGHEAAKGFDYSHSDLQDIDLHRLQHRFEGY